MKIGILTVPFNNNYGGFLQAYALKTVLEGMGHEVLFINRQRNPSKSLKFRVYRLLVKLHLIKDYLENKKRAISVNTDQFRDKYLTPISPAYYSSKSLRDSLKLGLDFLIVGSDQVWRYKYAQESIDDFFFGFIDENNAIPRISYAASFGTDNMDYPLEKIQVIKSLLTRFRAISVREESGKSLLTECLDVPASKVQTVLDPTMLLKVEDYKIFFEDMVPEKKDYAFTYILDKGDIDELLIERLISRKGLQRIDGKAQTGNLSELDVIEPVEKWLSHFFYSDYVITDSFHGTVFSILFNKPFIVIANPNRGIARLKSLLSVFRLEERLITSITPINEMIINQQIDWTLVNTLLTKRREDSIRFIVDSVS